MDCRFNDHSRISSSADFFAGSGTCDRMFVSLQCRLQLARLPFWSTLLENIHTTREYRHSPRQQGGGSV